MTKTNKRKKKLSPKAKEAEIAHRVQNIQTNIRRFNRILKDSSEQRSEKHSKLQYVYLNVTADLAIIRAISPDFSDQSFEFDK